MEKNFLDVAELIRSLQRAEGNPDCFQRNERHCDQVDCAWRPYCLDNHNPSRINGKKTPEDGQK